MLYIILSLFHFFKSLRLNKTLDISLGVKELTSFGFNTDGRVVISMEPLQEYLYVFCTKDFPTVLTGINGSVDKCQKYIDTVPVCSIFIIFNCFFLFVFNFRYLL
jgi:hypothetical protein